MKRKNTTRSALFTSIISLLLCVSMLVGTTFAWFTDSVVSGNNVIAAGNLDIELYHDGDKKVDSSTNLFDGVKWEPGVVIYENFTIKNEGNLALLYDFAMNWGDYNTLDNQYNLTQVLKVAKIDGPVSGNRDAAIAAGKAAGWKALNDWSFSGEMTTKGETKDFALIIYWEPSDNDNNWNVQNGKQLDKGEYLYVNLGINLQATQKMHESDSFGKDYDALANAWDGVPGELPEADENGVITITTGAELAAFANTVNGGNKLSGKTVKLGADINLNNHLWTPIGQTGATQFAGAFDGNGKTIYNLKIDNTANTSEHGAAGLFGWVEQHSGNNSIQNLTIDGVTIYSHRYSGAIAGWINVPVTNCTVKNVTINCSYYDDDTDGTKVGALVGMTYSDLIGNTVDKAVLNAYGDVGGLAGVAQTNSSVDGNTVKNVRINYASTVKSEPGAVVSTRVTPVIGTNTTENVTFVKSVIVSTAEELAAALKSTDKDIVITLANDIDVPISSLGQQTGGSGEYKLAGEATETITLDLNNKKLTLTTSYMTSIGAKNADATITIKNGSMNGTGNSAKTWNINNLIFANCSYVFENVTFDKEVALTNTGKTTTMKNVTINGTGDYYALWISARGQNIKIDGLTINSSGRGIKIDEQYVDAPAKVTLKVSNAEFNTVKKGAIMVKSAAGADITLSNVDISGVKMDTTNAVWVDSDATAHADKVTVTGGTKINESDLVTDNDALDEAIKDGATTIKLAGGIYIIPDSAQGKTLTIIGLGDTVIATQDDGSYEGCDYSLDGSTVTFENITINTDSHTYTGYARLNATYKNCTINGTYTLYGNSTFENCTFDVSGDVYNIWTWGAPEVTFTGCTFNSDGKAMLLYGTVDTKLTLNGCTFNDKGGLTDLKAAVEIGNDYNKSYELIVNNTVVNGYEINDKGINTGTTLWGNKNSMGTDKLNVVVDGVDVY